ncbi:MAG: hypothetical protein LBJ92_04660 [Holosporales bacterium]|jgi:hypothetical protein|nr:hypothetical protein [Holosporales bacterium]
MNKYRRRCGNKTKREVISEIIALLFFVILTYVFKAYSGEFNTKLFLEQAESLHLKDSAVLTQYKSITKVREEIDAFVKHEPIFDKYLDKICGNVVGNTMLKMLAAHAKAKHLPAIRIVRSVDKDKYVPSTRTVHINFDLYDTGGISKRMLCGVGENMSFTQISGTLTAFLFHELCHAFHHISGRLNLMDIECSRTLEFVYSGANTKRLWSCDEELYNITGYHRDVGPLVHDPICCNMFDMWQSLKAGKKVEQRVFHVDYEYYDKIMDICSFTTKDRALSINECGTFSEIMRIHRRYGKNPDFLSGIDKLLIDVSSYILTEN